MGRWIGLAWEAPQSALGLVLLAVELAGGRVRTIETEGGRLVLETGGTAVSLGHVVFWSRASSRWHDLDERNRAHELGHARQSRLLGPLYLPIVGLPSSARAVYAVVHRELTGHKWRGYYDGFPERWADRLGGVAR
jgi:hypothetical protein